ncbi:MAG TPA: 1,4-alpha-glucan branching protein GlgB, partial [Pirellulales bacterium]|nr:1,4-alpha-glucan branching protein GlgB [Pirellulales bacterium]
AVWAPNARDVTVEAFGVGNHPLRPRGRSGIWEAFVPGLEPGAVYKYRIQSRFDDFQVEKADPFGFYSEVPPRTASVVHSLDYDWKDQAWMAARAGRNALDAPWSIYELHLGSWRRTPDGFWLTYRELAAPLVEYLRRTGFTHVEFMPLGEHPFYGSWGYQTVGYFTPTARYGTPQDLMYLIDQLHQNGIGVVLDWVPSHFPNDGHGLAYFDGTHLYEHADPKQGLHPDWNTFIFNFGRNEVRSFLLSSALFWLDKYHIDGVRVDAVASMLRLDYSRRPGEWVPNEFGGPENLAAIHFLRDFNRHVYADYPDVQTFAEESSSWPMVSRPTYVGGLGFGFKWDMGWMHDTLRYMGKDPIFRRYEHSALTFRGMYACSENFVLSLSHDEVVYGKGSLLNKMPGDEWRKFANLRLLFGYMYALPGKKLLFMGDEIGARDEWNHDAQLDWGLLDMAPHRGVHRWVADLNRAYRGEPALFELDFQPEGFEWIDCCDSEQSTISFIRRGRTDERPLVAVCNFTPVVRRNYRLGVPGGGWWRELLNSDAHDYGGSGQGNLGGAEASPIGAHGRPWSLNITLPPLAMVLWKWA